MERYRFPFLYILLLSLFFEPYKEGAYYWDFFLLEPSILQVLISIDEVKYAALRRLNYLIITITIYELWKEMNRRFHNGDPLIQLIKHIKLNVAYKIRRWKFKNTWTPWMTSILEAWQNVDWSKDFSKSCCFDYRGFHFTIFNCSMDHGISLGYLLLLELLHYLCGSRCCCL